MKLGVEFQVINRGTPEYTTKIYLHTFPRRLAAEGVWAPSKGGATGGVN